MNNKRLIAIFTVLLAAVMLVWITDHYKGESTFDGTIVELDSAKIDKITVKIPSSPATVLQREAGIWQVESGGKAYKADSTAIAAMLNRFTHLKASQLVTRDPEKWKEYELTDSLASVVTFYESGNEAAKLYVGKVNYSRGAGNSPYGGGFTATTYLRVDEEKPVYAVPDFLKAMLMANSDDYRNKKLVQVEASKIEKLEFSYPGDSSFTLEKNNGKWMLGGEPVDSAKTAQYVSGFAWLSGQKFLNDFDPESTTSPRYTLTISTVDGKAIAITALPTATKGGWALQSSANDKNAWFDGQAGGLMERVFLSSKKITLH